MGVTILPNAALLWDYYIGGFFLNNAGFAFSTGSFKIGVIMPGYTPLNDTSAIARQVFTFGQGGSGVTDVMEFFKGTLCWKIATTNVAAVNGMGGIPFTPITDITGLDPAFRMPSFQRVNWLTMNVALEAGSADRRTGIMLIRNDSVQTQDLWPVAPALANTGGFGIFGNGSGSWAFESFDNTSPPPAVLLESVDLAPFIADATDFNQFDFVIISGAGGREAVFQLFVNNVLRIERNWVTGITLFPLAPDTYRWQPVWRVGDTSNDAVRLQGWEFRMGRFTPDGRELLK